MEKNSLLQLKSLYRIARNIGGNYIWRIARKSKLADFNLAVFAFRYVTLLRENKIGGFKFGGLLANRQSAKFNSPPIFPAIQYVRNYSIFFIEHCIGTFTCTF